ncbi:hypothetical protein [Maridesulfovibrio salexigens]|uniref:Uncharacterized protein n=1 Tax=Maridesulfovibrio salexigens (strain ATCC 14822 / DSM 2638 / NCIMB 8403 / VKM B-1763) TaxID=526222 RepID=C6BTL5_MARSD|nr:hypothetical protein [Maridesulfovibrio salexigens]ACS79795.1 hypothetical protein Desal_1733 [Maridesulfovibrio salexigens DSM 2638]
MSAATEKVHQIEDYQQNEEVLGADIASGVGETAQKDMGKVAIIISFMAVVLLVVFFYGLNQNLTSLTAEVKDLQTVRGDVEALNSQMAVVDGRLVELEKLPTKTRHIIMDGIIEEMNQKAAYVGAQLSEEEQAKLAKVQELLKDVQSGLQK